MTGASPFAALVRPELLTVRAYEPEPAHGAAIRLDANEAPPLDDPRVLDAVARSVGRLSLSRYPDPTGEALRAAISRRFGAPADELVLGVGSDEVIAMLATALSGGGRGGGAPVVVIPTPTFAMFSVTARVHGLSVCEVPVREDFTPDVEAIGSAIGRERASLVFLASPNNPTGAVVARGELEALLAAHRETLVVLDEAYADYAEVPTLRELRASHPNLCVMRTLSKIGLAALRVGWLDAPRDVVGALEKVRLPYNMPAPSQLIAAEILDSAYDAVREHVARVRSERDRVAAALSSLDALHVYASQANFLWLSAGSAERARSFHAHLRAGGVLVRSFAQRAGREASCVRATIGSSAENDALLALSSRWSPS